MRIGSIAGVSLKVNWLLLFLCIVYSLLGLLVEIIVIFSAVIIHELAHIVVAKMLGINVVEAELFPFGGQAKIDNFMALDPEKEIYVAIAGPFVSLLVAGSLYFVNPFILNTDLSLFITINMVLGLFNLIPVIPLDGGRILRSFLSPVLGFKKSTENLALLGKIFSIFLIGFGCYKTYTSFTGANFIVLGIFLFWAAHREGKMLAYAFMRFLVNKKRDLSINGYLPAKQVVSQYDVAVKKILEMTRPTYYLLVVVIDTNHQVQTIKTEAELIEVLLTKGPNIKLKDC